MMSAKICTAIIKSFPNPKLVFSVGGLTGLTASISGFVSTANPLRSYKSHTVDVANMAILSLEGGRRLCLL